MIVHWIHRFLYNTAVGDALLRAVERVLGLALVPVDDIADQRVVLVRRPD